MPFSPSSTPSVQGKSLKSPGTEKDVTSLPSAVRFLNQWGLEGITPKARRTVWTVSRPCRGLVPVRHSHRRPSHQRSCKSPWQKDMMPFERSTHGPNGLHRSPRPEERRSAAFTRALRVTVSMRKRPRTTRHDNGPWPHRSQLRVSENKCATKVQTTLDEIFGVGTFEYERFVFRSLFGGTARYGRHA
jgi:hypothetical protein